MLDVKQFRDRVVRVALQRIDLWSPAAESLVLGTAVQESHLHSLVQIGGGPAIGLFQMEPATHDDLWKNFLAYQPVLAEKVKTLMIPGIDDVAEMGGNAYYAAAMCRVHYRRCPKALPAAEDIDGLGAYWKQYYNTPLGAGTAAEWVENYRKFVLNA